LSSNPLFISGTSRGGTNLAIMMLSVNSEVSLSQDPFLALYKSFNNAVLSINGLKEKDLHSPIDEYYYYRDKVKEMHLLQKSDLNLHFDNSKLEELKTVLAARMKLSSPLLIQHLDQLKGNNFKTLFDSALDIIKLGRNKKNTKWIGFNDNWCIEFFAPLARTYKNAKFISIIRDVRGAIASHIKLVDAIHTNPLYQYKKDVSMLALTMSFARCWRKHVAFSYNYQMGKLLKDRILIINYEKLVKYPQKEIKKMCDFLNIDYIDEMSDTEHFISPNGGNWLPNSNQGNVPQNGIFTSSIDKWKETLTCELLNLIELIVGLDLQMCGYKTSSSFNSKMVSDAYIAHKKEHINWKDGGWGWRTDNYNPELDISFELLRRNTIENDKNDKELLELMLLFPELINNYN
jgi:hypothetical protein